SPAPRYRPQRRRSAVEHDRQGKAFVPAENDAPAAEEAAPGKHAGSRVPIAWHIRHGRLVDPIGSRRIFWSDQGHFDGLLAVVTQELDLQLVAGVLLEQRHLQVVDAGDWLAI